MAVVLLNYCGAKMKQIPELIWNDVLFNEIHPDHAMVLLRMDDNVGATHDYRHLTFPAGALLLKARYDYLLEQGYTSEALKNMPVVSSSKDPTVKATRDNTTAAIRTTVYQIGVSQDDVAAHKTGNYAGATKLLQTNYEAKLMKCGLEADGGLLNFLCGKALKDVTSDNYRSMTDPDACELTSTYLRRYRTHTEPLGDMETPSLISGNNASDSSTYTAPAVASHATKIQGKLRLKKGERLAVRADAALTGSLTARGIAEDGSVKKTYRPLTITI